MTDKRPSLCAASLNFEVEYNSTYGVEGTTGVKDTVRQD